MLDQETIFNKLRACAHELNTNSLPQFLSRLEVFLSSLIRVICEICGKKNTPLFLKYYLIPHRTLRGIILRRLNGEALLILRPAYLFSASKKFDGCNLTVAGLFRK